VNSVNIPDSNYTGKPIRVRNPDTRDGPADDFLHSAGADSPRSLYVIISLGLRSSTMGFRGFPIQKSTGDLATSRRLHNCNAASPKNPH
jgi:hypothetical protein